MCFAIPKSIIRIGMFMGIDRSVNQTALTRGVGITLVIVVRPAVIPPYSRSIIVGIGITSIISL
jgi:hypothetical protein